MTAGIMGKSEFAQNVDLPFHVPGVGEPLHRWGLLSEDISTIWRCELMQAVRGRTEPGMLIFLGVPQPLSSLK